VFEALDAGRMTPDETVTASEYAASMGGSQIFLAAGESMRAEDMIKSVIIASANDAATALAEHIAGSEDAFVALMNKRATELGMANTRFENVSGLDDTAVDHKTTARDISIMSRELIVNHPKVLEYSGIWMDTIRDGAFGLTNTNRLIRFYSGATGLKTGSTAKAGFCISATAERNGMKLIAVIMGAPNRDARNADAKALLDFGFANYETYTADGGRVEHISVKGGTYAEFAAEYPPLCILLEKGSGARVRKEILIEDVFAAPIADKATVGKVIYTLDGEKVGEINIVSCNGVDKIGFGELLQRVVGKFLLKTVQ
jgi:D-alanyl-D-alanine carboxypeptidase (penicillin-binding protein 5/6)